MKKLLSILLVVVILTSLVPCAVFADVTTQAAAGEKESYMEKVYNINLKSGIFMYKAKKYDIAIQKLNKAISYNKQGAEAYMYKGLCYLALEDYESAMKNIDKAFLIDSSFYGVYAGNFENNVYTNNYLGLSMKVDEEWIFTDLSQMILGYLEMTIEMSEAYGEEISPEDKAVMMESILLSIINFSVSKLPVETQELDNPRIAMGMVRMVNGITNGKMFLNSIKENFDAIGFVYEASEIQKEVINDIEYQTMSLQYDYMGTVIHEKPYVTSINGYLVFFNVIYVDEQDYESLHNMLEAIEKK